MQTGAVCQWERRDGLGIAVDITDRICPSEYGKRTTEWGVLFFGSGAKRDYPRASGCYASHL
jgi:hypothetical protein